MRTLPLPAGDGHARLAGAVGNVAQNAIYLGDPDNDGANELVLGTADGELVIFKGQEGGGLRSWRRCRRLGHLTAVCVGDVTNEMRNSLVALAADGWCYVFDLDRPRGASESSNSSSNPADDPNTSADSGHASEAPARSKIAGIVEEEEPGLEAPAAAPEPQAGGSPAGSSKSPPRSPQKKEDEDPEPLGEDEIVPVMSQRLPPNVKEALLFDVNNDGLVELVLALTDRVVRSYQWQWKDDRRRDTGGRLVSMNKWEFGGQVGSVTCNRDADGSNALIVAQPGGALLRVRCKPRPSAEDEDFDGEPKGIDYEELASYVMRNPNVSSEIVGGFDDGDKDGHGTSGSPYAICTLDGNLILARDAEILWSLELPEQLFCVRKMDVTGDGRHEVVVTSWGGSTYVVTQEGRATEYVFPDGPVCTFTCGDFDFGSSDRRRVLVFVTFSGAVHLFSGMRTAPEECAVANLDRDKDTDVLALIRSKKVDLPMDLALCDLNSYLLYGGTR